MEEGEGEGVHVEAEVGEEVDEAVAGTVQGGARGPTKGDFLPGSSQYATALRCATRVRSPDYAELGIIRLMWSLDLCGVDAGLAK